MSKNILFYIYFALCVQINGHAHTHHSSHTTSHINNNNNNNDNNDNNEESYIVVPEYEIIGNNSIIEDNIFNKFVDSIIKKDEYYNIAINYYVSNIILDSKNYYGECLVFNSQINENITIINIENSLDYNDKINYDDYINNELFNNNSDYCIKYQPNFSKNNSLFMMLFVFMLIMCFFTECCSCYRSQDILY